MPLCPYHASNTALDKAILIDLNDFVDIFVNFHKAHYDFRVGLPDHELLLGSFPPTYDWMESVYGSPTEEIPDDAPVAKGNLVKRWKSHLTILFVLDCCFWGHKGVPPHWRCPQIPWITGTGTPNLDPFPRLFF